MASINNNNLLGPYSVFKQIRFDLFEAKNDQDPITATYTWLADQLGHFTLGLVPTLFLCWCLSLALDYFGLGGNELRAAGMLAAAGLVYAYWRNKELNDFRKAENKDKGNPFPFDANDLKWNIATNLFYFGAGGLAAIAAFAGIGYTGWFCCRLSCPPCCWAIGG